jgi:hypothetical protein
MAVGLSPPIHLHTRKKPSYDDLASHIEAIEKMGSWIVQSKFFGCDYPAQGHVIAMELFLTGMSPIEYQRRNKIVQGKPFKQYDSMLAEFHEKGGVSRLISKTPELASIELTYREVKQTFSLTWEEAQKESFVYHTDGSMKEAMVLDLLAKGTPPKLKAKYATPRSRAIMMFARVVSDGIRSMCPEVNYGTYTPEEGLDFIDAESVVAVDPAKEESKRQILESKKVEPVKTEPAKAIEVKQPEPVQMEIRDESLQTTLAGTSQDEASEEELQFGPATPTQIAEIKQLLVELNDAGVDIKQKLVAKLKQHGLEKLSDLCESEATRLIQSLAVKNVSAWFDYPFFVSHVSIFKIGIPTWHR